MKHTPPTVVLDLTRVERSPRFSGDGFIRLDAALRVEPPLRRFWDPSRTRMSLIRGPAA